VRPRFTINYNLILWHLILLFNKSQTQSGSKSVSPITAGASASISND